MLPTMDLREAAVLLGRQGGKAKVPKGFAKMSETRRKKIAKAAIRKRWEKEKDGYAVSNARGSRSGSQGKGANPC